MPAISLKTLSEKWPEVLFGPAGFVLWFTCLVALGVATWYFWPDFAWLLLVGVFLIGLLFISGVCSIIMWWIDESEKSDDEWLADAFETEGYDRDKKVP